MAVSTSRLENIGVVTIDRPQHRNAVDHATAQQLASAFLYANPRKLANSSTGARSERSELTAAVSSA